MSEFKDDKSALQTLWKKNKRRKDGQRLNKRQERAKEEKTVNSETKEMTEVKQKTIELRRTRTQTKVTRNKGKNLEDVYYER